MIQFLAGAVTIAYVIAAVHFLRFWRKTSDRLFVSFASAFLLFAAQPIYRLHPVGRRRAK